MGKARWSVVLSVLLVVVALAFVGSHARRSAAGHCALDGARIEPLYRVRVLDDQDRDQDFCCIRCATLWLAGRRVSPRAIYVTDEASGQEVDARQAYFVRSTVVTTATTGNRIHAFRTVADAERHVAAAHGRPLLGADRPFFANE